MTSSSDGGSAGVSRLDSGAKPGMFVRLLMKSFRLLVATYGA